MNPEENKTYVYDIDHDNIFVDENDILNYLRNGFTYDGCFQQFVPVYCYIDIPIPYIISKLSSNDKREITLELLNKRSYVIVDWLKETKSLPSYEEYIIFLTQHMYNTRDFVRIVLKTVEGTYCKKENKELTIVDEESVNMYLSFCQCYKIEWKFDRDQLINIDLRTLPSTQIRPMLKNKNFPDESIEVMFGQTTFNCE